MAETPRLVVHPGFRKAGSTSIQALMKVNRERLAPHLRVHPRDALTEPWRKLAMKYCAGDRPKALDEIRACAARLREEIDLSGPPVAISDENLIGSRVYNRAGETLTDWAVRILPILEEAFAGVPMAFVFYTREREAWLKSAWNQEVRLQFQTKAYPRWRAAVPEAFTWDAAEAAIRGALSSPVTFLRLEDEAAAGVTGATLLRTAGVPEAVIAGLKDPGAQNASLPGGLQKFILQINRSKLDKKMQRKVRDMAMRHPDLFRETLRRAVD